MRASPEAVVIGGSLGGAEALQELLPRLPAGYEPAVIVVLHQHRHGPGYLTEMVRTRSPLQVLAIEDKEPVRPGRVHVCPANYHVLVEHDRTFALSTDPPVNLARPSLDVVFESAARVYRDRLVGVLLSGASRDGALGLRAVRAHGGLTACQDPATAIAPIMPSAGCAATSVDLLGSPEAIGLWLTGLRP